MRGKGFKKILKERGAAGEVCEPVKRNMNLISISGMARAEESSAVIFKGKNTARKV